MAKDRRDEIILQQMEVIRSMTESSISRMGMDFWGNPKAPVSEKTEDKKPKAPEEKPEETEGAAPEAGKAEAAEENSAEKIEDLQAELDSYIGL